MCQLLGPQTGTLAHSTQYLKWLTFEGQEDPGSGDGLVGSGQPPR